MHPVLFNALRFIVIGASIFYFFHWHLVLDNPGVQVSPSENRLTSLYSWWKAVQEYGQYMWESAPMALAAGLMLAGLWIGGAVLLEAWRRRGLSGEVRGDSASLPFAAWRAYGDVRHWGVYVSGGVGISAGLGAVAAIYLSILPVDAGLQGLGLGLFAAGGATVVGIGWVTVAGAVVGKSGASEKT